MRWRISCLGIMVVAAAVCLYHGPDASAESYGVYLGWESCRDCHGTIVTEWEGTRHARAFASLKKTNQEGLPGCLKCHVSGYEEQGGFIDPELTPELGNVQCEECHGPGKVHAADPGKKGSMVAAPGEEKCRKCHTPGQDRNFDYSKKSKLVHSR
jgi:hypothetical protein